MSNREKSNSGIGLDLLANQNKTKKINNIFSGNQNINLSDDKVHNDSDNMNLESDRGGNDNDSYRFQVNNNVGIDDSKVGDLEKLNKYHDTFTEPTSKYP